MEFLLPILLLAVGLVLIIKGGDFFVDAASWIAEVSGIPKLIVGATVVSMATTLPELFVSMFAAIDARAANDMGLVDMAVGNAIGSVTANIGLILAIAMVAMPTLIKRKDYAIKIGLMLGAALVTVAFALWQNGIGIAASLILLVILAVAVWDNVHVAVVTLREEKEHDERPKPTKKTVIINILKFVGGAAAIVFGADLLVDNGSEIATLLGVPDRIIAVTLIAVGTSLPELVTTVTAIAKKQSSLSAGNILGANIIDLTLIMPVCALISGGTLPITDTMRTIDIPACLIIGGVATIPTLITKKFARWQGVLLLALYAAYLVLTCFVVA